MRDGYYERVLIAEDFWARFVAWICSSSGHGHIKPGDILGRPSREQFKAMKRGESVAGADGRLAEKDAERKRKFEEHQRKKAGQKAP